MRTVVCRKERIVHLLKAASVSPSLAMELMAEVVFRLLLHLLFVLFWGVGGCFFRNPFASFLDSQDSSSLSLFEIESIISNHDSFPPHPESTCNQPSYPKVHLNSASGYHSDVFSLPLLSVFGSLGGNASLLLVSFSI